MLDGQDTPSTASLNTSFEISLPSPHTENQKPIANHQVISHLHHEITQSLNKINIKNSSSESVSSGSLDIHREDVSDTERKLREAGVYFRLPDAQTKNINEASGELLISRNTSTQPVVLSLVTCHDDTETEVAEVLQKLDTTLANYSSGSSCCSSNNSSESSPGGSVLCDASLDSGRDRLVELASAQCSRSGFADNSVLQEQRTSDSSVAHNKPKLVQCTLDRQVTTQLASENNSSPKMSVRCLTKTFENSLKNVGNEKAVVTICPYSERGRLGPFKLDKHDVDKIENTKSISELSSNLRNFSSKDSSVIKDSVMEPLNLIEEVVVPDSSVAMRAFFPAVEYNGRESANISNKSRVKSVEIERSDKATISRSGDSDSGHGSGATSPCGTLTDPPSPPPSPPDSRHTTINKSTGKISEPAPQLASSDTKRNTSTINISGSINTDRQHISILTCSPIDNQSTASLGHADQPSPCSINTPSSTPQSVPVESAVVGKCKIGSGEVTVTSSEPREANHFVVVAIDFGTTYSGYAFSFTRDADSVHMMKKWEGGDPGVQNQKTPTIVLFTPDRKFHSLGFTARDQYHDLDPKEAATWLYFDKFKMELHDDRSLSRDSLLVAANGQSVSALEIFSHALGYFRDHAIRELQDLAGGAALAEGDVRWVITVPAIWSHPAKQFMRTAAYMAGLGSPECADHLLIALEPEAAAIYCRSLHRHQLVPGKSLVLGPHNNKPASSSNAACSLRNSITVLEEHCKNEDSHKISITSPGVQSYRDSWAMSRADDENFAVIEQEESTSPLSCNETVSDWLVQDTVYMVVDCGGGTVDITVHQMTDTKAGHLKELHKATGGPYGSTGVDKEFEQLLDTIFTPQFMTSFKQQRPAAFVDLMIAFESRKRNASLYRSNPLNIALPFSFIDMYKKTKGKDVESAVKKHGTSLGVAWSSQGMLRVGQDTMRQLFATTLHSIQQSIESVLSLLEREASTGKSSALQYLFLVGGFSESELLQQHIRDAFSHRVTVVIPQGMGLAILRGAVQFGLDPSVVTVRRSRLTYGVGVLNRWQEGIHPQEKRVVAAGADWCADVLDVFVRLDESVAVGDVVSRSYTPATSKQATVVLHLYATHEGKAMHFVSDPGVQRVGTLHLDLRNTWSIGTENSADHCCHKKCCCSNVRCRSDKNSIDDDVFRGDAHERSLSDRDSDTLCEAGSTCSRECQNPHDRSSCCSRTQCLDDKMQRREISVHLKFGDTEVKASAVDHKTGKCVKANFDFLSL